MLAAAIGGLVWLRRENTWRERLLICWCLVPIAFFTVWPVKGYQYLLPIAPVVAVLAGPDDLPARARSSDFVTRPRWAGVVIRIVATAVVVVSLLVPTWNQITRRRRERSWPAPAVCPVGGRPDCGCATTFPPAPS